MTNTNNHNPQEQHYRPPLPPLTPPIHHQLSSCFSEKMVVVIIAMLVFHHCSIFVSSSSNQRGLYNDNFHEPNTSSPCFARYVMESFFRDYDSFTDSNFLEYMGHKIGVGSETRFVSLLNIKRHLIGEGSHRRLSSICRFSIEADLIADFSSHICELIMVERLPNGVFADPFELQHLHHRGVFKDVAVFGDTNLELPSFLSNQSIAEVHLDAASNTSAGHEIVLEFKIEIPLHARYPPLEESGYSKVRFGSPDLFMYCKMHEKSPAQSCLLSTITSRDALELNDIIWNIPAGIKTHSRMVSVVTFTSALLSAALIILATLRSRSVYDGRLKQS